MSATILVVMGVSGSGKSTLARALAARLGWAFAEGDAFHDPESIARMAGGTALDDSERGPWLARIGAWIEAGLAKGECGVVACSALRRAYRECLVRGRSNVRIVYLHGERDIIAARLAGRRGHFMPAGLLDSQFAILEPPGPDEDAIIVDLDMPSDRQVTQVVAAFGTAGIAKDGEGTRAC